MSANTGEIYDPTFATKKTAVRGRGRSRGKGARGGAGRGRSSTPRGRGRGKEPRPNPAEEREIPILPQSSAQGFIPFGQSNTAGNISEIGSTHPQPVNSPPIPMARSTQFTRGRGFPLTPGSARTSSRASSRAQSTQSDSSSQSCSSSQSRSSSQFESPTGSSNSSEAEHEVPVPANRPTTNQGVQLTRVSNQNAPADSVNNLPWKTNSFAAVQQYKPMLDGLRARTQGPNALRSQASARPTVYLEGCDYPLEPLATMEEPDGEIVVPSIYPDIYKMPMSAFNNIDELNLPRLTPQHFSGWNMLSPATLVTQTEARLKKNADLERAGRKFHICAYSHGRSESTDIRVMRRHMHGSKGGPGCPARKPGEPQKDAIVASAQEYERAFQITNSRFRKAYLDETEGTAEQHGHGSQQQLENAE